MRGPPADSRVPILLTTRALRGFADGAVSVILPLYLTRIAFNSLQIGAIVFGTLAGSAALTLIVGLTAHRSSPRAILLYASALMTATGVGFFLCRSFWPLFAVAVVGTLNPSAGDVSLFLPIEQTALAMAVETSGLTATFAWYNVAGALAGALGALISGVPTAIAHTLHTNDVSALSGAFLGYSVIAIAVAALYWHMPAITRSSRDGQPAPPLRESRRIVIQLAALFSLDSFGGGFVVQSLLALWLFQRFNLAPGTAAIFFFSAGVLGALSQFASSAIAARIGRIRTMVYTHIPSNLFLILAAFMPGEISTLGMLLMRSALSQMDVPARQSYVMAVVQPEERAAAASVTNVPRSLASAFAPLPAGALLDLSVFGWPLVCAGGLKLIYDLILLAKFRSARPADEIEPVKEPGR
jgi:MFS family permease